MEPEEDLPQLDTTEVTVTGFDDGGSGDRRRVCAGCERPETVCLCDKIPSDRIATATRIVVLHHPHELRHRLATVPVLAKCLQNCEVIVGRKLWLGSSALLDSLYVNAVENREQLHRAVFLFPGTNSMPSTEINKWRSSAGYAYENRNVLIVFDGTWKHAKEMVSASLPFISKFATCVCFNYDVEINGASIYDSELVLRKEPFSGCMSTMEAVARALRIVEPSGVRIEEMLVDVLKSMVHRQAFYLKPMRPRPRPKLLKEKCRGRELDN